MTNLDRHERLQEIIPDVRYNLSLTQPEGSPLEELHFRGFEIANYTDNGLYASAEKSCPLSFPAELSQNLNMDILEATYVVFISWDEDGLEEEPRGYLHVEMTSDQIVLPYQRINPEDVAALKRFAYDARLNGPIKVDS